MNRITPRALAFAPFLLAMLAGPAASQTAGKPPASRVNVYQYAVDNPVENSPLRISLSIGASVPPSVKLTPCADEKTYAYFYYDGQPVIVEQSTRSVVRIGQ